MDRDELIRALADRVLRLCDRVEKNTEAILSLTRKVTEAEYSREELQRESQHEVHQVGERLAVIRDEVTGLQRLHVKEEHVAITAYKAFAAAPMSTRILTVLIFVLLVAGGWLHAFLK